jgi:O-methyltransferase
VNDGVGGPLEDAYIELLKRAVLGEITKPVTVYQPVSPGPRGGLVGRTLKRALIPDKAVLARPITGFTGEKDSGQSVFVPPWALTMIGTRRLDNVESCMRSVLENGVPGDFIETGVWKGGTTIFMRGLLKALGITDRRVYVADSFEGVPPPDPESYPADRESVFHLWPGLAVDLPAVKENFARFDLLDEQVEFVKGWFRDTLPALRDHTWAVIRLDGDLYESTMDALENLYGGLSVGGWLIVDDYEIEACRQAVTDFRAARGVTDEIRPIDGYGVCWQKAG